MALYVRSGLLQCINTTCMVPRGSSRLNPVIKRKHTGGESRVRWPRRSIEALSGYAGGVRKAKVSWNWIWCWMWSATRQHRAAKGRPGDKGHGKVWGLLLPSSLLVRVAIRNSSLQTTETCGKVWSKGDITLVEEDWVLEPVNKLHLYKSVGPDVMHPHRAEGAGHCHRESLKSCGNSWWERILRTGRKQMFSLLSSGRGKTENPSDYTGQPHLSPWKGTWATNPGSKLFLNM